MTIPGYKEARDAWAGPTAIINAMDDAEELARRGTKPGEIREYLASLKSDSEKEFFQRGWLNAQMDKVDAGSLTTKQIRQPLFEKQFREVFGEQTDAILEALRTEVDLTEQAGKVIGGPSTARILEDVATERASPRLARAAGMAQQAIREPGMAALRLADIGLERLAGPRRAAHRAERATTLLQPASALGDILGQVEATYANRQRARQLGQQVGGATASQTARTLMDYVTGNR